MKQFEIKTLNKALMLTIAIPFAIVYIFAIILYVIDRVEGESSLVFTFIVAMIPLILIIVGLNKICKKKCTVECSDTEITLRRNGLIEKSIMFNDIMLVSQSSQNQSSTTLSFFTQGHVKPDLELLQVNDALAMRDILNIVLASNTYVETQRIAKNNQMFKEYINQSMVDSEATVIATIKSGKMQNKQTKVILIAFFGFFIIIPIIAVFVANGTGNNDSYRFEDDAIFYNDIKLDVNPKEVDQLNFNLIKDSSHVYYKGEILDWADSKTFENLQSVFYSDKNGVYYETSNMFSKNQILPLAGKYDHATFQSVGHLYYKDKNNLYKLDFSIAKLDDNPLEKVEVEGLDITSFEGVGESALYWFKDKNRVYFASEKKLKPANDIDAQTFEVITWEVAKDKNHVYYLTKDLESDEHSATDHADYAILEGADAATFEKVGYNEFKDKNMDWTIER